MQVFSSNDNNLKAFFAMLKIRDFCIISSISKDRVISLYREIFIFTKLHISDISRKLNPRENFRIYSTKSLSVWIFKVNTLLLKLYRAYSKCSKILNTFLF